MNFELPDLDRTPFPRTLAILPQPYLIRQREPPRRSRSVFGQIMRLNLELRDQQHPGDDQQGRIAPLDLP